MLSGPRYYKYNHQIEWQYHLRQTSVLQFCCSEVEPHAAPVPACGVVILLVRFCVPVPQFLLHVDQAPHAPMTQSTAEICKIDCTVGPGITSAIIKLNFQKYTFYDDHNSCNYYLLLGCSHQIRCQTQICFAACKFEIFFYLIGKVMYLFIFQIPTRNNVN